MTRARSLSCLLWSILMSGPAAGCGGDDDSVGHLADAPPIPDAVIPDAAIPDAAIPDTTSPDAPDAAPAGPALSLSSVPTLSSACGDTQPATVGVMITNTGGSDLVIGAEVTGGFSIATTLPLTIGAGATAAVSIRPPLAVIGTDRGGTIKSGTLTVTTNEPGSAPRVVELAATVIGANLEIADLAGHAGVSMTADGKCPDPGTVVLRNTGNRPITISAPRTSSSSAPSFAFNGFSGGTLQAGDSTAQQIKVLTENNCSGADNINYDISETAGPVCTSGPTVSAPASYDITGLSFCSCP